MKLKLAWAWILGLIVLAIIAIVVFMGWNALTIGIAFGVMGALILILLWVTLLAIDTILRG